ncbi:MAG: sulfotransferase [FCB group bacterium]|jgi:hypothetical protein|nr:sulfotransferase [FCB group bacterium]
MDFTLLFIIGAPRSGSTMLERMLASHSQIQGGPEPHLLTPLAHAGLPDAVDAAPYDAGKAAAGLRRFVASLPRTEADYWAACRAYCEVLYGAFMSGTDKRVCLDKTPAYALVLPFMQKVFPDGKYVVLTRNPLAMFSSFANSFFDGDYFTAQQYNPLLERYVPALAAFLRQDEVPYCHVRYEELVKKPEETMERVYAYIGVPFERETIDYGNRKPGPAEVKGLGDPIGVAKHTRPTTASVKKWVEELAADPGKQRLMREIIDRLAPEDLAILGYPKETLWKPLDEFTGIPASKRERLDRYRLQRRAIVRLRGLAQTQPLLRRPIEAVRAACESLLQEE